MKERNSSLHITEDNIPEGPYCYSYENGEMVLCPFWDKLKDVPEQESGYCHYLQLGDRDLGLGLLWDQCKECGINFNDREVKDV